MNGIEIKDDQVILNKAVWNRIVQLIEGEFGDNEQAIIERVGNGGWMDKQAKEEAEVEALLAKGN